MQIGRYRVVCKGSFVIPPFFQNTIMTFLITFVPSVCQMIFLTPTFFKYFEERADDPDYERHDLVSPNPSHEVWIQLTYALTILLSCGSLFMTAMTEPGIIPRNSDELLDQLPQETREAIDKSENYKFYIRKKALAKMQTHTSQRVSVVIGPGEESDLEAEGGEGVEAVDSALKRMGTEVAESPVGNARPMAIEQMYDARGLDQQVASVGNDEPDRLQSSNVVIHYNPTHERALSRQLPS